MPERLQAIGGDGFRGLPRNSLDLKSKNLCLLGGNGKGKSALVDAVEFAFSGTVARFLGAGTGSIRLDDVLQNVRVPVKPRVTLAFQPSNVKVTRSIGQEGGLRATSAALQAHLDQHPPPDRFMLRRSALLDFIRATDGNRHQMFMRLVGLVRLELVQGTLREARDSTEKAAGMALITRSRQLETFRTGAIIPPSSAADLMRVLDALLQKLAMTALGAWDHLDDRIGRVAALRRVENVARIDQLNAAITALGDALPDGLPSLATRTSELAATLKNLESDDSDAARVPTVEAATSYLLAHPAETMCPVCERTFEDAREHVLEHLQSRLLAQSKAAECRRDLHDTYSQLRDGVRTTSAQLRKAATAGALLEDERFAPIVAARDAAELLVSALPSLWKDCALDPVTIPASVVDAEASRRTLHTEMSAERNSLLSAEAATVEDCHRLLALARERLPTLLRADSRVAQTKQTMDRLNVAQEAIAAARDKAVQKVMDRIAGKVLGFYEQLHAISATDKPECSDVSFRLTGRAERGSTQLVVKFLGKEGCDPKEFLSDGHLDSLGLCIYLACVRLFNPEGTLLILDDVLTSVDREHRHRVGELLFSEFSRYQIIITTMMPIGSISSKPRRRPAARTTTGASSRSRTGARMSGRNSATSARARASSART